MLAPKRLVISSGLVCFTVTLYLLCAMVPPGGSPPPGERTQQQPRDRTGPLAAINSNSHIPASPLDDKSRSKQPLPNLNLNIPTPGSKQSQNVLESDPVHCGEDCHKLEELFRTWPQHKPRAVIYYLTRVSRLGELQRSLVSVERNFNRTYQYPIVIFHEAELNAEYRKVIRTWTNCTLFFQQVELRVPDFLPRPVPVSIPCRSTLSYRHMCRFQAKLVYQQPILQSAQFLWRLDDESVLTNQIDYDVFEFMRTRGFTYGYIWEHRDAQDCVTGLWNYTADYIRRMNIPANRFNHQWTSPKIYYNNFEVSSMDLWRSEQYQAFIEYIDLLGGIYLHRWGDAPIKGIAVSLFVPTQRVHHFRDIGYQHNTFVNKP